MFSVAEVSPIDWQELEWSVAAGVATIELTADATLALAVEDNVKCPDLSEGFEFGEKTGLAEFWDTIASTEPNVVVFPMTVCSPDSIKDLNETRFVAFIGRALMTVTGFEYEDTNDVEDADDDMIQSMRDRFSEESVKAYGSSEAASVRPSSSVGSILDERFEASAAENEPWAATEAAEETC